MANVSQNDLLAAVNLKFMKKIDSVNLDDFTANGTPDFEGSGTLFPNGRTEKFIDFNGTTDYYSYDGSSVATLDQGIIHVWIKPDFDQTSGTSRVIHDFYDNGANKDQVFLEFGNAVDDWRSIIRENAVIKINTATVGETWSADNVIHMVLMWKNDASLYGGKSLTLYINNVADKLSGTTTWSSGGVFHTACRLGTLWDASGRDWDGGIFDFALLDYDTLAASYSDAEIVQSLYDNSSGLGGGVHKFVCDLELPSSDKYLKNRGRDRMIMFDVSEGY